MTPPLLPLPPLPPLPPPPHVDALPECHIMLLARRV